MKGDTFCVIFVPLAMPLELSDSVIDISAHMNQTTLPRRAGCAVGKRLLRFPCLPRAALSWLINL